MCRGKEDQMFKRFKPIVLCALFLLLISSKDSEKKSAPASPRPESAGGGQSKNKSSEAWQKQRENMVNEQIKARGVSDPLVLGAMRKVPRHLFVPASEQRLAYGDHPLPIGKGQTISQPYIVAFMTEQLALKGGEKVLEVGTGSGYQAAVLSLIAGRVFSIEIICPLAESAAERLKKLEYKNVSVRCGDGYQGWPEEKPFDAIIVTAAPGKIPEPLIDQLKPGGRMIIPVGNLSQELILLTKSADGKVEKKSVLPVRFVPMTGESKKH
jgi:protein-L-isoaspartate(D-aspartate) O-methyltransferase